jgi:starch synthase (maltosyl-transferring)
MPDGDRTEDARIGVLARNRIAIENVSPEIDAGRFAAKGVLGRPVEVLADAFGDGHEVIGAAVLFRKDGSRDAAAAPMTQLGNDRWRAEILPEAIGAHHFTVVAWRDLFGTWHHDTAKKVAAGQDVSVEIEEARLLLARVKAKGADGEALKALSARARWGAHERSR